MEFILGRSIIGSSECFVQPAHVHLVSRILLDHKGKYVKYYQFVLDHKGNMRNIINLCDVFRPMHKITKKISQRDPN